MCRRLQISHSHYCGGPALWTALDRAKVEAYEEWRAGVCQTCGTHAHWWDPAKGGSRDAFIADFERCPGCEVKEQLQRQAPKDSHGLHVELVPRDVFLAREDARDAAEQEKAHG